LISVHFNKSGTQNLDFGTGSRLKINCEPRTLRDGGSRAALVVRRARRSRRSPVVAIVSRRQV
jgi:hypothetical protein